MGHHNGPPMWMTGDWGIGVEMVEEYARLAAQRLAQRRLF